AGSNRRPPACKAGALPAELQPQPEWERYERRRGGRSIRSLMLDFSLCSIRSLRVSPVKKLEPPDSIRYVVGLGRIELPTSRLSGVRSNHLSYRPCGPPNSVLRQLNPVY